MLIAKIISTGLSLMLAAPAAPAGPSEPAEVESVFDMGLDAAPPPPPEPRADTQVESVFDMGLDASPPPPPSPPTPSVDHDAAASGSEPSRSSVPPPSKLRQAGWGTLIGGFTLASAAGLTFGFAERERGRTRRISLAYDLYGTSPRPLPEDIANTLDVSGRNRTRFLVMAAGLAGSAMLAWVVAGVMLGVARKRRRAVGVQARTGTIQF